MVEKAVPERGFHIPSYTISFGPDHSLQFDPPQGSKELAIALSVHFPMQRTLEEKMREATLLFLQGSMDTPKHLSQSNVEKLHREQPLEEVVQPPNLSNVGVAAHTDPSQLDLPSQAGSKKRLREVPIDVRLGVSSLVEYVWNSYTGKGVQKKTRRRLEEREAVQVYENRGNICDKHKAKKTKCDPTKCPGNKLFKQHSTSVPIPQQLSGTLTDNSQEQCKSKLSGDCSEMQLAAATQKDCPKGCKITVDHSHLPNFDPPEEESFLQTIPDEDIYSYIFEDAFNQSSIFHEGGSADQSWNPHEKLDINPWEWGYSYQSQTRSAVDESDEEKNKQKKKRKGAKQDEEKDGDGDPGNGDGRGAPWGESGRKDDDGNGGAGTYGNSSESSNTGSLGYFDDWHDGYNGWSATVSRLLILLLLRCFQTRISLVYHLLQEIPGQSFVVSVKRTKGKVTLEDIAPPREFYSLSSHDSDCLKRSINTPEARFSLYTKHSAITSN
ncbi:hypothetical protein F5884DRAFT_471102 [Xylogone sp. PMI_703]|nr:hypothetical protein F5884DRAFT_471102 [Xylogone sp. PMI_703]